MKSKIFFLSLMGVAVLAAGCGDVSRSETYDEDGVKNQFSTPEQELGIEAPGKLAASVEAWANSNDLGYFFKQSRERLSLLHAQLIEDYNVRKESDLEPTDFTFETVRKYKEAYEVDSALRKFMVECYSRKDVRPLPQTISRWFTTSIEERANLREDIGNAPSKIKELNEELIALNAEIESVGFVTWSQERELKDWKDLQIRLEKISNRANKANSSAAALAANMANAVRLSGVDENIDTLNDSAEQLKTDFASFASKASQQLEIANGQILIAEFAANCKDMAYGWNAVPSALAKKKERQAQINNLISRISSSRTRGYSDLNLLAQQATAIKSRSRSEGEVESKLGKRVQKLAENYQKIFGTMAIYRLKQALPVSSAQARIDTELESFKRAINLQQDVDPVGAFAGIESKAYQLADRMEEEAMLKRLDDTLRTVQQLAARRRYY